MTPGYSIAEMVYLEKNAVVGKSVESVFLWIEVEVFDGDRWQVGKLFM